MSRFGVGGRTHENQLSLLGVSDTNFQMNKQRIAMAFCGLLLLSACASTTIVESPRTTYVAMTGEPKTPQLIWTSRTLGQSFDYLAQVNVRSWSYDGAIDRLIEAGKEVHADAIIDVHFAKVGFLTTMDAFAVKFKEKK